jgi:hypothetical protein
VAVNASSMATRPLGIVELELALLPELLLALLAWLDARSTAFKLLVTTKTSPGTQRRLVNLVSGTAAPNTARKSLKARLPLNMALATPRLKVA